MLPSVFKMPPAYTHLAELWQHFFIYYEETHFTSYTSCTKVHQLLQRHFSLARQWLYMCYAHLLLRDLSTLHILYITLYYKHSAKVKLNQ